MTPKDVTSTHGRFAKSASGTKKDIEARTFLPKTKSIRLRLEILLNKMRQFFAYLGWFGFPSWKKQMSRTKVSMVKSCAEFKNQMH